MVHVSTFGAEANFGSGSLLSDKLCWMKGLVVDLVSITVL